MEGDSIDLVYVLGSGSAWENNEMRYSLRSVEKNLAGVRNVYVVGENPGIFSDKVFHIYYPDLLKQNADGNMARKILRACQENALSDNWLFMNDDFIINKPMVASEIPWLDKGDMAKHPPSHWNNNLYRRRLRRTYDVLKNRGYKTMQYDYHAPMLMNKHAFQDVMALFDFEDHIGYTFRSLYGNVMELPSIHLDGQKVTIYRHYDTDTLREYVHDAWFVGYNDSGLNASLKLWLKHTFPEKSKYERPTIEVTKSEAVAKWFASGCDYLDGIAIFARFTERNKPFVKYLQSRHNEVSEKRLKIALQSWLR